MDHDDEEEERGMEEDEMMVDGEGNVMYKDIREQDRFLPIANIARIMKKVLPGNAKIAKDAKESIQECVSEYISFITSEASDKCQQEKRKTINGDDLLWAMSTLGFEKYIDPLKIYLAKYRESVKGDKPEKKTTSTTTANTTSTPTNTLAAAAMTSVHHAAPNSVGVASTSALGAGLKTEIGSNNNNNNNSFAGAAGFTVTGGSNDAAVNSSINNSAVDFAVKGSASSPMPLSAIGAFPSAAAAAAMQRSPAASNNNKSTAAPTGDSSNGNNNSNQTNKSNGSSESDAANLNTTHMNMSGGVAVASAADSGAVLPPMADLASYNPYDANTGNLLMGGNLNDAPLFLGQRSDSATATSTAAGIDATEVKTTTLAQSTGPTATATATVGGTDDSVAPPAPPEGSAM